MFGTSSARSPPAEPTASEMKKPQRGHGPKEQPALPVIETRHELPPSERTAIPASPSVKPTSSGVRWRSTGAGTKTHHLGDRLWG